MIIDETRKKPLLGVQNLLMLSSVLVVDLPIVRITPNVFTALILTSVLSHILTAERPFKMMKNAFISPLRVELCRRFHLCRV